MNSYQQQKALNELVDLKVSENYPDASQDKLQELMEDGDIRLQALRDIVSDINKMIGE